MVFYRPMRRAKEKNASHQGNSGWGMNFARHAALLLDSLPHGMQKKLPGQVFHEPYWFAPPLVRPGQASGRQSNAGGRRSDGHWPLSMLPFHLFNTSWSQSVASGLCKTIIHNHTIAHYRKQKTKGLYDTTGGYAKLSLAPTFFIRPMSCYVFKAAILLIRYSKCAAEPRVDNAIESLGATPRLPPVQNLDTFS